MENPQFRNFASNSALKWGDFMAVNECKMVSATAFPKGVFDCRAFTQYDEKNNLGTTMFYIIDNFSEKYAVRQVRLGVNRHLQRGRL